MSAENPDPESIFGNSSREIIRRSASRLLNNYSNPWDPLAEGAQNSVDAINRKYRSILAEELSVTLDELNDAIETATTEVVKLDIKYFKEVSNSYEPPEIERQDIDESTVWGDEQYQSWIRSKYYSILARELGESEEEVEQVDKNVRDQYQGEIVIKRKRDKRKIVLRDNGIGMSSDDLKTALKRYGTFKSDEKRISSEIGELGNGLTYLLTNCNNFSIESCDGSQISQISIEGMLDWVNEEKDIEEVQSSSEVIEEDTNKDSYTKIEMSDIREGESDFPGLFDERMSEKRIVHMIRNKTAIGQIFDTINYPAFNTLRKNDIDVSYVEEKEPDNLTLDVDFEFEGPAEVAEKAGRDESLRFPVQLELKDAQEKLDDNTSAIGEKSVVAKGIWESPGGIKHYYEAFVASRGRYRGLSREYGYCDDPQGGVQKNKFDLEPAIEIGVKGMPCGSSIEIPATGGQGYWGNMYIMIMNNELSFDEGREKPATGGRGLNFQDCAEHVLFREIGVDVVAGTTKGSDTGGEDHGENLIEERTADREELQFDCLEDISFQYEPTTEQDVVAIFHEALMSDIFPDNYTGLDTSTWHTYDEIYHYEANPEDDMDIIGSMIARNFDRKDSEDNIDDKIIVEFKKDGDDILTDLESNKKIYSEIDMLICWDMDEQKANLNNLDVTSIEEDSIRYWGTTHTMEIDSHLLYDSSNNVYVMNLSELFKRYDNDNYHVY
jgi:hypothetical protein